MPTSTADRDRQKPNRDAKIADTAKPLVEMFWRNEWGGLHAKRRIWYRPKTKDSLIEWLDEYFDMVDRGYCPPEYKQAPRPHCARITLNGVVIAEYHPNPKQRGGSHVGDRLPLGGGLSVPPEVHDPPQEVKPNSRKSKARAKTTDSAMETARASGDTDRRSPAETRGSRKR